MFVEGIYGMMSGGCWSMCICQLCFLLIGSAGSGFVFNVAGFVG